MMDDGDGGDVGVEAGTENEPEFCTSGRCPSLRIAIDHRSCPSAQSEVDPYGVPGSFPCKL